MEVLARLQPMDVLFAILWAAIVGWGLQTGLVRQVGMLVGVYGASLVAGTLYRPAAAALTLAFGREGQAIFEFTLYVLAFVVTFALIGVLLWRAYPLSRLSRNFGTENLLGAAVAAIWGVLFLIALLTILRYFAVVPLKDQETSQLAVLRQVQTSQIAPVLEVVASPLWQAMAPWFPTQVPPHLSVISMATIGY
ncbi:MAG: hypothetical protein NVSMB2_15740 [Chloroflexota bacterium]